MKRSNLLTLTGFVAAVLASCPSIADDWPTWRYDAGRTGACPTALPDKLKLQWRRELPPVVPAWPYERRMQFDTCYEPVVMGRSIFIGSPVDGSVAAYDTDTGDLKWRVYTNGPVRFAPVTWRGRLYVASDDGRVYCLDAATGKANWTFRAAPNARPDLHHLGNNRLVSFWPVRGGPLLVDGVLYFGSGIWPTMGTFVYALDAESGKVIWSNDRLNYMANIRTDHNRIADSALAPQGYLVMANGKLMVPNGRSMPVGLNPKTGELLYYIQGYRNGECRVTANGKYVYVGRRAVLDVNTGREVGERWHEGHEETPKEWSQRYDLFETPFVPYKFIPACDAWSVLGRGTVFGAHEGTFYAYDVAHAKKSTRKGKRSGIEVAYGKWEAPLLWKVTTVHSKQKWPSSTIIRAGDRLYGHTGQILMALVPASHGKQATVAWEQKLPGTPASMLAGDEKLFVVTQEGHILCFGAKLGASLVFEQPNGPLAEEDDPAASRVAEILRCTKATDGYCLVLGLETGRIVEEILRQSKLKVIAVDSDRRKIDALRDRLAAARVYGDRAEAFVGDPFTFELPPYLASLVVTESHEDAALPRKMAAEKLLRVLRPYGGVACLEVPVPQRESFAKWLSTVAPGSAKLSYAGPLALLRRVGPLPDSAHWTHECASAARTYFSKDKLVKAPLGVLWYGDGPDHGFKKYKDYHIGVKPQVVNGSLIAFNERSKILRAYDVYTGRLLWQVDADPFTRFASMPDGVYAAQGNTCSVYEPHTGELLRRFRYRAGSADQQLYVADVRVGENVIVVAVAFEKVRSIPKGLYNSTVLIGLDRKTGEQRWTVKAKDRFNHHGLSVAGGLVFAADSPSADKTADMKRRGNPPETTQSAILALNASTGQAKWQREIAYPFLSYHDTSYPQGRIQSLDDSLFYSEACDILIAYKDRYFRALNGKTGEQLWERKGAAQPIIVKGEIYYEQGGAAFDVRTGKHIPGKASVRGGNGCNHAIANENLFFRRRFTAAYFDIHTGRAYYMRSARSGCTNSLIPADGVVSSPCFSVGCVCNHPVETSFCLMHMPVVEGWEGSEPVREPLPLGERDPEKWRKLRQLEQK